MIVGNSRCLQIKSDTIAIVFKHTISERHLVRLRNPIRIQTEKTSQRSGQLKFPRVYKCISDEVRRLSLVVCIAVCNSNIYRYGAEYLRLYQMSLNRPSPVLSFNRALEQNVSGRYELTKV